MDIQNTQSQMRKGVLEFCILSIIRQGEVYPSDIVDRMNWSAELEHCRRLQERLTAADRSV